MSDQLKAKSSPKRILIIEDEALILEMYKIAFEAAGFSVEAAASGQEGWQSLQKADFDLVLLDIKMDGISGIEILGRLQREPSLERLPVWVLTNVGEEAVTRQAMNLGAEEYIMKTKIKPSELVSRVRQRLERGKPLLKGKRISN